MSRTNKKYKGFLMTEITVAIILLGFILTALALSLGGFARFNRYQLVRQRCIAAAQAQLDSITATSSPIPDEAFSRLWPKLTISVTKSPGTGQWQAMTLAEVTATGKSYTKEVKVRLSRYVPPDPAQKETAKEE